jgi:nicotinamide mononucleotide transporter
MQLQYLKKSIKSLKWYEWLMAVVMIAIAAYAMITAFVDPSSSMNPPWLTVINFVSAIAGVFCVFLCAKGSVSNFVFAVVNTAVYIVYLWYWKIYGTMMLELCFYQPINIISWWLWTRHRDNVQKELTKSRKLTAWQNAGVTAAIAIGTIAYHEILVRIGGNVAWLDAATLAIGIIAVVLEMFRFREQYVWWIITDVIAVAMYIQHFDPVYLTKKSIYLIVAVIGLINWVKLNKRNKTNE